MLSENLNFFYRLNKELTRLNIKFKILNFSDKIPNLTSIVLTTQEELEKIKERVNDNAKILSFAKQDNFKKYILKILAYHRIGIKTYSDLTFSIDPGTKRIGLVVFLDDYYLESNTYYLKEDLLNSIENYVNYLQEDISRPLNLEFKFGRGILQITLELVRNIFSLFKNQNNMNIFLIDEYKSSKIKIHDKEKKISKDETSAFILALRDGIEVNKNDYVRVFNNIKNNKFKKNHYKKDTFSNSDNSIVEIEDIILKMIEGELSLSKSSKML